MLDDSGEALGDLADVLDDSGETLDDLGDVLGDSEETLGDSVGLLDDSGVVPEAGFVRKVTEIGCF